MYEKPALFFLSNCMYMIVNEVLLPKIDIFSRKSENDY
jgi:hypothetical protein